MSADVGTIVNGALASFTGIAFGIIALATTIVHQIAARSHSPKIAIIEKDLEIAKGDIKEIQGQSANISAAATVATAVMPTIGKDIQQHQQQIIDIEKSIADLTAKLNQLQSILPANKPA